MFNVIKEAEIWQQIEALPDHSFIKNYCWWGLTRGQAPLVYHLGTALSILSSVASPDIYVDTLPGDRTGSNLWVMIVGRSGVDRKSSATNLGLRLLDEVAPERIATDASSRPGMIKLLDREPCRLFYVSEGGDFLKSMNGDRYASEMKPFFTRLFDGGRVSHAVAKGAIEVPRPHVSMLMAVNPELLERHMEIDDWEGGFMSRFVVLHSHVERPDPTEPPDPATQRWLVQRLSGIYQTPFGKCVDLEPEARERYLEWQLDLQREMAQRSNVAGVSIHGRVGTHAVKLALLWMLDCGDIEHGGDWLMSLEALEFGIHMSLLHYRCSVDLASLAQPNKDMREKHAVLRAIRRGSWTDLGEITREACVLKRRATELLDTLVIEGEITQSGQRYLRIDRVEQPRDDSGVQAFAFATAPAGQTSQGWSVNPEIDNKKSSGLV